jgi:hypothetical protein
LFPELRATGTNVRPANSIFALKQLLISAGFIRKARRPAYGRSDGEASLPALSVGPAPRPDGYRKFALQLFRGADFQKNPRGAVQLFQS